MRLLRIHRLAAPLCVLLALAGCDTRTETPPPAAMPVAAAGTGQEIVVEISDLSNPTGEINEDTPFEITRAAASRQKPDSSQPAIKIPFQDPIQPALYELPSGALATWRGFSDQKPALILFSNHPFLDPLPPQQGKNLRPLLLKGRDTDIIRRGRFWSADPAFISPQTVSAVIDSGLISELVFVRPTSKKIEEWALEGFRDQALAAGFITAREAMALQMDDGVIHGTVRGIPLRVVHPLRLPAMEKPVLIHVDLSYFMGMYVNEIRTPVYNLLFDMALDIRDRAFQTLAFTISHSNQEVGLGLESRFLTRDLAELVKNPDILQGDTPPTWAFRASAFYASTMFSETRSRELVTQAVQSKVDDAATIYALALQQFQQRQVEEAFVSLDRAVILDPGYAQAYTELAEKGWEMGQFHKAIELLQKAATTWPENPFARLRLIDLLLLSGRGQDARPLIDELRRLPWDKKFHPDIPALLEEMAAAARNEMLVPNLPAVESSDPRQTTTPFHMGIPGH